MDELSDKALVGFLKVIVEINRDIQLVAYKHDSRLSLGNKMGFDLRMGFGLHAGWAIEGAVGSLQKVDATYLSPHVNMAARMEAATRQFGVSVLITRSFFRVSRLSQMQNQILLLIKLLSHILVYISSCQNQLKVIAERLTLWP